VTGAYLAITILTILANAGIAAGDFRRASFVVATSTAVGVPQSWLPMLGTLKLAGVAGLAAGMLGVETLGVAAGVGLTLFYTGAIATHVRAGALRTIAFPGAFLALAAGSLVLALLR
jgi:hypothetical protein